MVINPCMVAFGLLIAIFGEVIAPLQRMGLIQVFT